MGLAIVHLMSGGYTMLVCFIQAHRKHVLCSLASVVVFTYSLASAADGCWDRYQDTIDRLKKSHDSYVEDMREKMRNPRQSEAGRKRIRELISMAEERFASNKRQVWETYEACNEQVRENQRRRDEAEQNDRERKRQQERSRREHHRQLQEIQEQAEQLREEQLEEAERRAIETTKENIALQIQQMESVFDATPATDDPVEVQRRIDLLETARKQARDVQWDNLSNSTFYDYGNAVDVINKQLNTLRDQKRTMDRARYAPTLYSSGEDLRNDWQRGAVSDMVAPIVPDYPLQPTVPGQEYADQLDGRIQDVNGLHGELVNPTLEKIRQIREQTSDMLDRPYPAESRDDASPRSIYTPSPPAWRNPLETHRPMMQDSVPNVRQPPAAPAPDGWRRFLNAFDDEPDALAQPGPDGTADTISSESSATPPGTRSLSDLLNAFEDK